MSLKIRKAEKEDVKAVKLMLLAWPIEDFLKKDPDMNYEKLNSALTDILELENNAYCYKNMIVAVDGEKIVGVICGYDGNRYHELRQPMLKAFGLFNNPYFQSVKETDGGEFYIDSIGVESSYRCKGIASKLFEAMEDRARKQGFSKAGLIVDIDNPKAEKLYRKLGFEYDDKVFYLVGQPNKHMSKVI